MMNDFYRFNTQGYIKNIFLFLNKKKFTDLFLQIYAIIFSHCKRIKFVKRKTQ